MEAKYLLGLLYTVIQDRRAWLRLLGISKILVLCPDESSSQIIPWMVTRGAQLNIYHYTRRQLGGQSVRLLIFLRCAD